MSARAATLAGRVTADGAPIPGAFVTATGPHNVATAHTDASGGFSMSLPKGTYRLSGDAQGFISNAVNGIAVRSTRTSGLALTRSNATVAPMPVYGGGQSAAADGTPGVFYITGGNAGGVYRSMDWGGTWTQVNTTRDDPASGLPETSSPFTLATSGYPGEVAVALSDGSVYYSADYGVTWNVVAGVPADAASGSGLSWAHAGNRSVLVLTAGNPSVMYLADMTAALPAFVRMTRPYATGNETFGVADGADRPWIAVDDTSGTVSVYPLLADATAPAPTVSRTGFGAGPEGYGAVALGGASAAGEPPSGIVVSDGFYGVSMSVKQPGDAAYPSPISAKLDATSACRAAATSVDTSFGVDVAPDTSGSYGAAWASGCWIQDFNGRLTTSAADGIDAAIDAGYNATVSWPGTDAVVLLGQTLGLGVNGSNPLGVRKLAGSVGGDPVTPQATAEAQPGTGADTGGLADNGITAATVQQTAFGPESGDTVSATDVGGSASTDGGVTFHRATYGDSQAVTWWRGSSGDWLLFGQTAYQDDRQVLAAFQNWTPTTAPVEGGNVSGSTGIDLGAPAYVQSAAYVESLAGIPGADEAFVDTSSGGSCVPACTDGAVSRVTLASGPSITQVTPIGQGVITKPGPLAYCPASGSAASLSDVLLVVAEDYAGGAVYRVTGASGPSPSVTKALDLPSGLNEGLPALKVQCSLGFVAAASGVAGTGLLASADGGQTFAAIPVADPGGVAASIRAIGLGADYPPSLVVGDAAGYVQRSDDGGKTWTVVNDPATGVNLALAANSGNGIWDVSAYVGQSGASIRGASRPDLPRALRPEPGLIAGAGEFFSSLNEAAPAFHPAIVRMKLSHKRFEVGRAKTAIVASAAARKRAPTARSTELTYSVSAPGTVVFFLYRETSGRRVGRRCVANGRRRPHGRRCVVDTLVHAALARRVQTGTNRLKFTGRIGRVILHPSTYLLVAWLQTPNGHRSAVRTASFTIVAARRHRKARHS